MKNICIKIKRWKYLAGFLLAVFFIFTSLLYVPLTDAIFGVPFVAKVKPVLKDDGFFAEIEVTCNRFYNREIGFTLDPPLNIGSIAEAQLAVSGKVRLFVEQDGGKIENVIDLSRSGWSMGPAGLTSKVVARYPPIDSFFCREQRIVVEVTGLNINLKKHAVTVYVSRDRRP